MGRTNRLAFTKKCGILGGMGPMASLTLYENIIRQSKASCDQEHMDIFLYSHATLPDRSEAIASGDCQDIIQKLKADLRLLESMGADFLAVPCNTSHYFFQEMQSAVSIPLLNMVELTVASLAKHQPKKVAILATEGTQATGIYQTQLEARHIPHYELPCHLQDRVNQLIYQEIKQGLPGNQENFQVIQDYLQQQEVDFVLLACTELSVYGKEQALPSHYIDSLEVLTQEILRYGRT